MFRLRPAHATDLAALLELASDLDSPNLPADEAFLPPAWSARSAPLSSGARRTARPSTSSPSRTRPGA